jgi:hypothetical protein
MGFRVASRSAEAVSERRETLDSPGHAVRSLRLRGASPPRKRRARAGNTRGVGTRSSFGWQKSVERVARLSHREVARPVGARRALARKKSAAPPDAGHGWAEGESVRVCRISKQSSGTRPAG